MNTDPLLSADPQPGADAAGDPRRVDLGPQARRQLEAPDGPDSPRNGADRTAHADAPSAAREPDVVDEHGRRPKMQDEEKPEGSGNEPADRDGAPPKPSPLAKTWVRVVLVVVIVLALVAGGLWFYRYWTHGRFVESTNDAYLQADDVTVSAKVSGTVEEVYVDDNQQVHVGDPLVRIDSATPRARVDQAVAQAAQGRASVAQYESQIAEQEAAIAQSVAAVQGAEAQRRYSQGEVDRYEPLARSGSETVEKLAQMVYNRDQALATLRQNQAQSLQARRRITTLRAQIGAAQAQVAQAEAQALQAQIDVGSSLIRASIDGRVGDRQVRVGMQAQIGTRMMTIVPVQSLYLVANFKETQIGLMRVGQPATVKVDALGGMALEGTVESFSPATGAAFALIPANNATGNFTKIVQRVPVRIRIEASEVARKVLVPGLSVDVDVDTVGNKDFIDERKRDAREAAGQRRQDAAQSVDRDRSAPASGAGR